MKKILVFVLLTGMLFTIFYNCNTSATTPPLTSFYLINASPDSQGLDFFLDGSLVTGNLIYGQDSGYFSASPGIHELQVRKAGESNMLIDVNIPLIAGKSYSIFAINSLSNLTPAAVSDNPPTPPSDSAEIRLLNFCVNSPVLNAQLATSGDTLRYFSRFFNDQSSTDTARASFKRVIAGTYILNLINTEDSALLGTFPGIILSKGKIYTIYLKGLYDSTSVQSIGNTLIQHN
ncbi:MAG TPA: DUF4397 domain-containing protein [Chitinophagaceae bacterium]|nr:DUF4397 domain-containing protein [Chitinophagaceae bacterium]